MNPKQFVETRTKRYMAQALEDFERDIEGPLRRAALVEPRRPDLDAIVAGIEPTKRSFRKKLQALGADCTDLVPANIEINGFEPVRR